ncbi:Uncharacterised protein [Yersinia enterocolitica]|nr:Uncharacterised protein [Yersinia enterocolitica]
MAAINPVTQAIKHPLHHIRLAKAQCIATTGHVVIFTLRGEPVVAGIVDPTLTQSGAKHIQLCTVVEYHIQNHFNTGFMQRFNRIT